MVGFSCRPTILCWGAKVLGAELLGQEERDHREASIFWPSIPLLPLYGAEMEPGVVWWWSGVAHGHGEIEERMDLFLSCPWVAHWLCLQLVRFVFQQLVLSLWLTQTLWWTEAECNEETRVCTMANSFQLPHKYDQPGDLIIGAIATQFGCMFDEISFSDHPKTMMLDEL